MPAAPAASCALCSVERTRETTSTPESPGIPARNGFNGFLRALPGDRACLPPSSAEYDASAPGRADMPSANLTPASGRQDHTTSPYATTSLVRVLLIAHGFKESALRSHRAQNAAASTASLPASVTIMIRPSVEWDAKSSRSDLGVVETEIFLQRGLDTKLPDGQITRMSRPIRNDLCDACHGGAGHC